MDEKTLTLALMDPPYESANSTTAMRIIAAWTCTPSQMISAATSSVCRIAPASPG